MSNASSSKRSDTARSERADTPLANQQTGRIELPHKQTSYASVPWSPWVAIVYAIVIFFAAQTIAYMLLYFAPQLFGWSTNRVESWVGQSLVAQFVYTLLAETLTFAAIWWFVRLRKSTLRAIGLRMIRLKDPLYTLGGFAVYFLMYALVLALVTNLIPSININQKQELGFDNAGNSNLDLILTFISLVVLPPIVEETVFRGFVFTGIRNKVKPLLAAIITSLLFATAHLQFGSGKPLLWVAAIDTFTLSMVLCYLRYKTDSLWPGILLHALKNGIAFVSLFLLAK